MPPKKRVLVIDPDADNRDSLALLLSLWDHEVATAGDSAEAVRLARGFRPDVILTEIRLARLDGYGLADQLRRLDGLDGVTVIALTGCGGEAYRRRSAEAGFFRHLLKPVEPELLRELLEYEPVRKRCQEL
jgi:CheY-like chemotaxis protein